MQGITPVNFQHYFLNAPSENSLQKVNIQIHWETGKIYALRAVQVATIVGLAALAGVGTFFLYSTSYAPVAIALCLVTAYVAKVAFSTFQSYIAERTQKKLCYEIFDALHPRAAEKTSKKNDKKAISTLKAINPIEFFQENETLYKLMAERKYPCSAKEIPLEIEEKRSEMVDLLTTEAQKLVQSRYFELELELKPLLTGLSPIRSEFAHLRLSQLLYSQAVKHLEELEEKEAKTLSWIPAKEILKDIDHAINKEASMILFLKVAEWTALIGVTILAGVGIYLAAPNLFVIAMITGSLKFSIDTISNLFNPLVENRKEKLKSYMLYDSFKDSTSFKEASTAGLKEFIRSIPEANESDEAVEEDDTAKPQTGFSFFRTFGSYYRLPENIGFIPLSQQIENVSDLASFTQSLKLPEKKIDAILGGTYFKTKLDATQRHFWALSIANTLHRKAYEDELAAAKLHDFAKAQSKRRTHLLEQWNHFDQFAKAANTLAKALETPSHSYESQRNAFQGMTAALADATSDFEPVETTIAGEKRIIDLTGENSHAVELHKQKLEALDELLQDLNSGEATSCDDTILKMRSFLKECAAMDPLWCTNAEDIDQQSPIRQFPIFLTSNFMEKTGKFYKELIEIANANQDAQLKQNSLKRIAALIREHTQLFAQVVKARDAKAKLDELYVESVQQIATFVTQQMERNNELAKILASDELDGDQAISCTPHFTPDPESLELEWDPKLCEFKGSPSRLIPHEEDDGDNGSSISILSGADSTSARPTLSDAIFQIRELVMLGKYNQSSSAYYPVKNEPTLIFSRTTSDGSHRERTIPMSKLLEPKDDKKLERTYFKMAGLSPLKPLSAREGESGTDSEYSTSLYVDWLHEDKPKRREFGYFGNDNVTRISTQGRRVIGSQSVNHHHAVSRHQIDDDDLHDD